MACRLLLPFRNMSSQIQQPLAAAPLTAVLPKSSGLHVSFLSPDQYRAWDEYVQRHPHGSPFHLSAWKKSIQDTFGYKSYCLIATEAGSVRGVLPLFLVNNLLTGRVLLSSPFAVYGGVLADDPQTRDAIRRRVEELGRDLRVQYVELRNAYPEQCLGFSPVSRYVTFTQQTSPDEQAILESIPRKVRYMVRKSLKVGFSTNVETQWSQPFVDLYLENLRRLGTPAFPEKHFRNLLQNFRGMADVREVLHDGKVVSAVLSFYFRDQLLPYYGASDPAANALAPNNFMYFDQMRWGGANGYTVFDFGRSKKEVGGSYEFKAHWGMMERELPYEMLLVRRKQLPNFSPANPKFRAFIQLWQRVPLPVTRLIGPLLIRLVP